MKLQLKIKKRELPLYILLATIIIWVCFIAGDFAKADGADLKSFLYDEVTFDSIGYEPIFSVLQLFFQIFSIHSPLDFVPPLIVATSISIHIIRSTQSIYLKFFWAASLVLPLSLQNFRVGSLYVLMLFIPVAPKYYGMLVHWSYITLFASSLTRARQFFIFALISCTSFFVFYDYFLLAASKVNFYIGHDFGSKWGFIVYFEWIFLTLIYLEIYKKSSVNMSTQVLILSASLICQFLALNVVASRLNLLSVGISLIELGNRKVQNIPALYVGLMGAVVFYQFLRFIVNIPDANIYDLFH